MKEVGIHRERNGENDDKETRAEEPGRWPMIPEQRSLVDGL